MTGMPIEVLLVDLLHTIVDRKVVGVQIRAQPESQVLIRVHLK